MTRSRRRFADEDQPAVVRRHFVWANRCRVGFGSSKPYDWKSRYGKTNEHNGQMPRDFWLEDWEKRAILDFHARISLEGYRRLAFMM